MNIEKNKKELENSGKNHPEEEYGLDRWMGYLLGGVGFFLILLKVVNPY